MSEIPPQEVYLAGNFDSNSLKVAQLRGLLLQYGVPFAGVTKKADLVQLFNERVRSRAGNILNSASRVQASNKGIITVAADGTESAPAATPQKRGRGRPKKSIAPAPEPEGTDPADEADDEEIDVIDVAPEPPVKRARGRSSKAAQSVEQEDVPLVPKSTAAKPRGRARKSAAPAVTPDPSDDVKITVEVQKTPAARNGRGRQSLAAQSSLVSTPSAPSSSRRQSAVPSATPVSSEIPVSEPSSVKQSVSKRKSEPTISWMENVKEEEEEKPAVPRSVKKTPRRSEESGFSDYNPFQSGSEDAAGRERRRRKSSLGLSGKKPAQPRFSEPAPTAGQDDRAATSTSPSLRRLGPSKENLKSAPEEVREAARLERERALIDQETSAGERLNHDIQARLNEIKRPNDGSTQIEVKQQPAESHSLVKRVRRASDSLGPVTRRPSTIPLGALFLLLLGFIANYKNQSASIGYCDSGASVNDIILHRQSALDNANACIARRTAMDLDNPGSGQEVHCDVSGLPLVPFAPRPTACAPCPQHAVCEDGNIVACDPEYILTPHPLSIISPALDGLPGVGPKAFLPSCRPDTAKKRMIGGLAKSMENDLAQGRGMVVCAGLGREDGRKGQGERYGMEESTLRERYAERRDPKFSREQFEEIFEAALKDLVEHDDVIESIDPEGRSWYAAARTELTMTCAAKLHAIDLIEQWRKQLASTAAVIAAIAYVKSTLTHRQQEKYKAEELVAVVLRRLQDQERLHYSDPVSTPHPFIPPPQLRDVVMPPHGSSTLRSRLWQRVQDLVEANANVAVREQEVRGELWKTWEWQGVGERHVTWTE